MYMRVFLHNWDVLIMKQIIWKKKLDEYDENPNHTYFEEQYDKNLSFICVFFHK